MTHLEYFKLQAKNLFKDFKAKTSKYFDVDEILLAYDWDEQNFSLMKAQHTIARMVGFRKWTDLSKASESELELAKLLLDNREKVLVEDWEMYVTNVERSTKASLDPESKLELFQRYLNGGKGNPFPDYSLN